MEVHHHSHEHGHHKKSWKSYIWEFVMLFLAVFCGFLAEWQLEHVIEHSREKEFIHSMIEDAQIDTSNIARVMQKSKKVLVSADSLANVCFNYELGISNEGDMYRLFRHLLSSLEALKPTERTLLQLNNSGAMRLIRNKTAADNIIFYDGFEKEIKVQQEVMNKIKYDFITNSYEIFNFKYFNLGNKKGLFPDAKLLTHDPIKLTQFANQIAIYGGVLTKYNMELMEMNDNALKLIHTLRNEYHLEEK